MKQIKEHKTESRDVTFNKFSKGGQTKSAANQTEDQQKINELRVQLQKMSGELDLHKQHYATKEKNETSADNRDKQPQQLTSHRNLNKVIMEYISWSATAVNRIDIMLGNVP